MSMFRYYTDTERTPNKSKKVQSTLYNCDICEEGDWTSETEVEIHRYTVHSQDINRTIRNNEKFACVLCVKQHEDKDSLLQHIKSAHFLSSKNAERIEREIFICGHCCRLFFNKLLLQTHIVQKHQGEVAKKWEVQCPKCFKQIRKAGIWGHLEYHRMASVSTCPICLEKCGNKADLYNHVEKHRRYYDCGICQFSTKVETSYYLHIQRHRKSKPSKVKNALKYFVPKNLRKRSLTYRSVHTAMKGLPLLNLHDIHICVICRHICTDTDEMKKHLTLDHTTLEQEKKILHTCICGEIFSNIILLKQHIVKAKDGHRAMGPDDNFDIIVNIEQDADALKDYKLKEAVYTITMD